MGYLDPKEPGSFSGLYGFAKNNKLSIKEARRQIGRSEVYIKNKPVKKPATRSTIVSFPRDQLQVDLLDLGNYSRYNYGLRYLLHGIDCFTREQHAVMTKLKTKE